jgi:hypothetical protein
VLLLALSAGVIALALKTFLRKPADGPAVATT